MAASYCVAALPVFVTTSSSTTVVLLLFNPSFHLSFFIRSFFHPFIFSFVHRSVDRSHLGWPQAFPGETGALYRHGSVDVICNHAILNKTAMDQFMSKGVDGMQRPFYLTTLREPLSAAISAFNFYHSKTTKRGITWEQHLHQLELVKSVHNKAASVFINPQAHDLGWYEETGGSTQYDNDQQRINQFVQELDKMFDLVLCLDRLDQGLVALSYLLNTSINEMAYVRQRTHKIRRAYVTPDPSLHERIYCLNQVDSAIYRHFSDKFHRLWESLQRSQQAKTNGMIAVHRGVLENGTVLTAATTMDEHERALIAMNKELSSRCVGASGSSTRSTAGRLLQAQYLQDLNERYPPTNAGDRGLAGAGGSNKQHRVPAASINISDRTHRHQLLFQHNHDQAQSTDLHFCHTAWYQNERGYGKYLDWKYAMHQLRTLSLQQQQQKQQQQVFGRGLHDFLFYSRSEELSLRQDTISAQMQRLHSSPGFIGTHNVPRPSALSHSGAGGEAGGEDRSEGMGESGGDTFTVSSTARSKQTASSATLVDLPPIVLVKPAGGVGSSTSASAEVLENILFRMIDIRGKRALLLDSDGSSIDYNRSTHTDSQMGTNKNNRSKLELCPIGLIITSTLPEEGSLNHLLDDPSRKVVIAIIEEPWEVAQDIFHMWERQAAPASASGLRQSGAARWSAFVEYASHHPLIHVGSGNASNGDVPSHVSDIIRRGTVLTNNPQAAALDWYTSRGMGSRSSSSSSDGGGGASGQALSDLPFTQPVSSANQSVLLSKKPQSQAARRLRHARHNEASSSDSTVLIESSGSSGRFRRKNNEIASQKSSSHGSTSSRSISISSGKGVSLGEEKKRKESSSSKGSFNYKFDHDDVAVMQFLNAVVRRVDLAICPAQLDQSLLVLQRMLGVGLNEILYADRSFIPWGGEAGVGRGMDSEMGGKYITEPGVDDNTRHSVLNSLYHVDTELHKRFCARISSLWNDTEILLRVPLSSPSSPLPPSLPLREGVDSQPWTGTAAVNGEVNQQQQQQQQQQSDCTSPTGAQALDSDIIGRSSLPAANHSDATSSSTILCVYRSLNEELASACASAYVSSSEVGQQGVDESCHPSFLAHSGEYLAFLEDRRYQPCDS